MTVSVDNLTQEQRDAASEWRNLCFTLEGAQAQNLIDHCSCKFQFAKTFLVYGREEEQIIAEACQSALQGNYNFFSERGVTVTHLSPEVVELMLSDWRGAIASKKAKLTEHFMRLFGEDIEVFVGTPHNSSRLILAKGYDETDAIIQLDQWSHIDNDQAMLMQLKSDVNIIKNQMAEMKSSVNELLKQMTILSERISE